MYLTTIERNWKLEVCVKHKNRRVPLLTFYKINFKRRGPVTKMSILKITIMVNSSGRLNYSVK